MTGHDPVIVLKCADRHFTVGQQDGAIAAFHDHNQLAWACPLSAMDRNPEK
jgi:hypothetical protein